MDQPPAGRIILVRHGETEANRLRQFAESDDIPLTEAGWQQAHELGLRLSREFNPELVFSSAFLRARQTADRIAALLHVKAEVAEGLHERDFGCLRGQSYERLGELILADASYDTARPWMWTPPDGESLDAVRRRAIAALEAIRQKRVAEIVVVCHGAVIQAVCAHITGEWRESFVPPNCGFAVVDHLAGDWGQPVLSAEWNSLAAVSSKLEP